MITNAITGRAEFYSDSDILDIDQSSATMTYVRMRNGKIKRIEETTSGYSIRFATAPWSERTTATYSEA